MGPLFTIFVLAIAVVLGVAFGTILSLPFLPFRRAAGLALVGTASGFAGATIGVFVQAPFVGPELTTRPEILRFFAIAVAFAVFSSVTASWLYLRVTRSGRTREPDLDPDLIRNADLRTGEPAWKRADIDALRSRAIEKGLACIGGQPQVRTAEATAELLWYDISAPPGARAAEEWEAYVVRSWNEVCKVVAELPSDEKLAAEAKTWFRPLSYEQDLSKSVWIVLYLVSEDWVRRHRKKVS